MKELKDGLSGIMCIKNEARFLDDCINSCIDALDELIVVYIKSDDETEKILMNKQKQYSNKLCVYLYPYDVLWFDMTQDEYEFAKELSEDDPRLYSSMCNYALSKVSYKYVIKKIDADQFYFNNELKGWRDICSNKDIPKWTFSHLIGFIFSLYISLYRRFSLLIKKPILLMLPEQLIYRLYKYYKLYSQRELKCNRAVVSLSGLNVFKDKEWYVPFDGRNIHPPYNGNGDHIIFPLSKNTYFNKHPFNRAESRNSYSITEDFVHPYKVMVGGVCWFHQHANRINCWNIVKKEKECFPHCFVHVEQFIKLSNRRYLSQMCGKIDVPYNKIYYSIVHIISKKQISLNLDKLFSYNI